jgi:hypothetical protein
VKTGKEQTPLSCKREKEGRRVKTKKEWTSQRLCRCSVAGHTGMSLMGVAEKGGPALEGFARAKFGKVLLTLA